MQQNDETCLPLGQWLLKSVCEVLNINHTNKICFRYLINACRYVPQLFTTHGKACQTFVLRFTALSVILQTPFYKLSSFINFSGSISKPISAKSPGVTVSRPSSQQQQAPNSITARGGGSRTPQESEHHGAPEDGGALSVPREPTPVPTSSVFMQAVDWLLEVKAIPVSNTTFSFILR